VWTPSNVEDSYSSANVSSTADGAGGCVGVVDTAAINAIYSKGTVTGGAGTGGLISGNTSTTVADSFWDTEASGNASSPGGGTGKTTAQMKTLSTYTDAGWDITEGANPDYTWGIDPEINDGYPFLQAFQQESGATVPDAPTGLIATAASSTAIDLAWTAPVNDGGEEIIGYQIQRRSPAGSGDWTTIVADTESTGTTYQDTGLTPETQYEYRVAAINIEGVGDYSAADDATTDAAPSTSSSGGNWYYLA
jgi:hypothetical protein